MKILIIGKGNVATNLDYAFRKNAISCRMVSSRDGLDSVPDDMDVYIYAVRDNALAEVINKVHTQPRALHLHTSGTMRLDIFGDDKIHCGVFYPFQTFSKSRIIEDFSNIPVFFEAKHIDDISAIYSLALTITSHIFETTGKERERLHVAGVFANNFSNAMYAIAANMLKTTHIPFSAILPLIDETAAKVHDIQPWMAQTGPAIRRDENVMNHHLDLIEDNQQKEIYRIISKYIQQNY